jgi:phosphatidylglycerophosphatase A
VSSPRPWATPFGKLSAADKLQVIVASSGGVGIVAPFAPGTFGTIPAVPLAWALALVSPWAMPAAALLVFALGVLVSKTAISATGAKDPQLVTIDEVAGYLVTLVAAPVNATTLLAAFVLFRFFDIAKPWPIRRFESLPGAWGVMADDIAAGVFAALCLQVGLRLFGA